MATGMSDMSLGDAYINVLANTSMLPSGFEKAKMMAGSLASGIGGALAVGIGAALTAGIGAAVKGLGAYAEAEAVTKRLADTMSMVGIDAAKALPAVKELTSEIMKKTTIDDDSINSAAAAGIALGVQEEKIKSMTEAAVGLSARLGIGVESAMRMLVRASNGFTQQFSRMGVQIDKTATKEQQFAQIMKFAAKGMEVAEGQTNTLSGARQRLTNSLGEVYEAIGEGVSRAIDFTGIMNKLADVFFRVSDSISNFVRSDKFQVWIDTVVGGFKFMWNGIVATGKTINALVKEVGAAVMWLGETVGNTVFYMGKALGSVSNAIATSIWEPMKKAAEIIQGIWKNMTNNIGDLMAAIWQKITNPGSEFKMPTFKGLMDGVNTEFTGGLDLIKESWKVFLEDMKNSPVATWSGTLLDDLQRIQDELARADAEVSKSLTGKAKADSFLKTGTKAEKEGLVPQEKMGVSIVGFSEMWKKAQERAIKDKNAERAAKAAEDTAKNTDKTNSLLERLDLHGAAGLAWGNA